MHSLLIAIAMLGADPSYGWTPPEQAMAPQTSVFPTEWVGAGEGQTRLLYRDYKEVHGVAYPTRDQGSSPSCVGQASAAAADFLAATQVRNDNLQRGPPNIIAAETIYGWSRINIGQIDSTSFGGGSYCGWAVEALRIYGVVPHQHYPGLDLTHPSPERCVEYGNKGVPELLVPYGQRHRVKGYVQITTWAQLRDAMATGHPVIVGSSIGWPGVKSRDKDGFLNRPRNIFGREYGRWMHAMVFIGVCDEGRRGVLCLNSWGDWLQGPQRFGDEPVGSFWVDARVAQQMVSQGDSYAIMDFEPYYWFSL